MEIKELLGITPDGLLVALAVFLIIIMTVFLGGWLGDIIREWRKKL